MPDRKSKVVWGSIIALGFAMIAAIVMSVALGREWVQISMEGRSVGMSSNIEAELQTGIKEGCMSCDSLADICYSWEDDAEREQLTEYTAACLMAMGMSGVEVRQIYSLCFCPTRRLNLQFCLGD